MRIAILGAGLSGIELGRQFHGLGKDFIILEKESEIGGMCRTNRTGDYFWDFAVHALYSRDQKVMDFFRSLPIEYHHLKRNVKIFHSTNSHRPRLLDYPFEAGIKDLPICEKAECIRGYFSARARNHKTYSNLKEWIENHLGSGIAKHFMVPYNNKIWSCDLSEISEKLVNSRLEAISVFDFVSIAFGRKMIRRAYQAEFLYPKEGIQNLVSCLARDIKNRIFLNSNVKKLTRDNNKWAITTERGERHEADIVISTIPLAAFLKKVDIREVEKEYGELKWNNTFFVMLGFKKGTPLRFIGDCQWVFFKGDEIFYRLTLMHNLNPDFPPAIVAEITQKGDMTVDGAEAIKDSVIGDLIRLGIIGSARQIEISDVKLLEYTYPIPTAGLDNIKKKIRDRLAQDNIFLFGRNGNWDYMNMDEIIIKAKEFVAEIP